MEAIGTKTVDGSVFLGGILNKNTYNTNFSVDLTSNNDGDSLSDDGYDCNLKVWAFEEDKDIDEDV